MLFGVNGNGVPSIATDMIIGQLPAGAAAVSSSVASDGGVQSTSAGGTAAPVNATFPNTAAAPVKPYPGGIQND